MSNVYDKPNKRTRASLNVLKRDFFAYFKHFLTESSFVLPI